MGETHLLGESTSCTQIHIHITIGLAHPWLLEERPSIPNAGDGVHCPTICASVRVLSEPGVALSGFLDIDHGVNYSNTSSVDYSPRELFYTEWWSISAPMLLK